MEAQHVDMAESNKVRTATTAVLKMDERDNVMGALKRVIYY